MNLVEEVESIQFWEEDERQEYALRRLEGHPPDEARKLARKVKEDDLG